MSTILLMFGWELNSYPSLGLGEAEDPSYWHIGQERITE